MRRDFDVFVESSESVEEFGQQIEQILGLKLDADVAKFNLNPHLYGYSYSDPEGQYWFGIVSVPEGTFADEGDKLFSTYNYQIDIVAYADDPQERLARSRELTRSIFERLKVTGNYRLLATENMAIKLDQFDPPVSSMSRKSL